MCSRLTGWLPALVLGTVLSVSMGAGECRAQTTGTQSSYRVSDYLGSPGTYGMSYGFASYGMPQTYSVFSAYPGPSYGRTMPPYGIMPGKFGVGLWRPGFATNGYVYGASYYQPSTYTANVYGYRTFVYGSNPGRASTRVAPPPVGVYAPYLGPRTLYGW